MYESVPLSDRFGHKNIVTSVHPRTSRLEDPDLPAVAVLLGDASPSPLQAAVAAAGGRLVRARPQQVTWWPGSSIAVRYRTHIQGGELDGDHDLVAVAGRIPEGALVVEAGDDRVGVWRLPHDPALPGLRAALDAERTGVLLDDLGVPGPPVSTALRAYRPGRRAVVALSGRSHGLYLKLLRPGRAEPLHRHHVELASELPVPHSLGFSDDLGMVALQAMPGSTLRETFERESAQLPAPDAIVELAAHLPEPKTERRATSPIERLPRIARLLAAVVPEHRERIGRLVEGIGPEEVAAEVAVHGDYYESQVMVDGGELVGLLDVDTYGWGRPGDDAATMLGHLTLWRELSRHPAKVAHYAGRLLEIWERTRDTIDLRRRTAAVLLTLAPGSFRVQSAAWPSETLARIEMAERWLESAAS